MWGMISYTEPDGEWGQVKAKRAKSQRFAEKLLIRHSRSPVLRVQQSEACFIGNMFKNVLPDVFFIPLY